jgi:hypothetical protein
MGCSNPSRKPYIVEVVDGGPAMQGLPDAQIEVELETRLLCMEFVRQADRECVRVNLHDCTFAPSQEVAQALCEVRVAEP